MKRLPTLFAAHGGGPLPVLGDAAHAPLTKWMKSVAKTLPQKPDAILIISAHFEETNPTITSGTSPELIYDYYGFPPESYQLKYPAPGSPQLAEKVASLLRKNGFQPTLDSKRGFDHGVFIPLMLTFPEADIPVVALSLLASLDPAEHIKMGETLAPLRDDNILIFASGSPFHNLRVMISKMMGGPLDQPVDSGSKTFDDYLQQTLVSDETETLTTYEERKKALIHWASAPSARYAHPREEHLLPLMVAFGAAKEDGGKAKAVFSRSLGGIMHSCFEFGGAS